MSRKNAAQESTATISQEAATWLILLKDQRRLSLQEGWQFLRWFVRSHRHAYEFLVLCRQDVRLTSVLEARRRASRGIHANRSQGLLRRNGVSWNVAAMVVLVLSVIFSFDRNSDKTPNGKSERPDGTIETPDDPVSIAAKEPTTRQLPDGTRVSLDAGSMLRVGFTESRREVHLEGEALFVVATEDAKRPFVVNTFLVDIAADEKSRFAVTIDTSVEVAVYEGVVRVSERGARAGAPVITVRGGGTYRVPLERFREIVAGGRGDSMTELVDG